jgi:hypothetical protein
LPSHKNGYAALTVIASEAKRGSLAQLAIVFHREERAIEKQGPEERSECGIQMLFPTKKTAKIKGV